MSNDVNTDWFASAGFGVFIHFGHAAHRGWELSWQMTGGVEGQHPPREPVACDEYFANAAEFDPQDFDAVEWARIIADSGAAYAVFTAKHHDGFAMFDTRLSDYSIAKTSPFGRDLTAELVAALREAGVRIGLYLSLPDWYHAEYPRMTDETVTKPYRIGSYQRVSEAQWKRYRAFFIGQLTELLTNYGVVDVLWLDGEFEHTPEEWDFAEIRRLVASLQPGCVVNDRCVGFGDFATPEQQIPERVPAGPWEICMTMTDSWGWVPDDGPWKSTPSILATLAETVSSGGNLLLNVGPRGDGRIPEEAASRLDDIGQWIRRNASAVYGSISRPADLRAPLPLGRKIDSDGEHVFVYCTLRPWDSITVSNIPVRRIESVHVVGDSRTLDFVGIASLPEVHAGKADPRGELVITIPPDVADLLAPVIDIVLRDEQSPTPLTTHG
ncbi:alpha-L-fucosidase [Agromyces fucosus]|uniref:alpha-L-fucosidase n=1 Tax=Agromyces fucosus TaxID=41985 RepID=UPI002437087C|nr:alpha-L-fucosidase [Agromyces fucosus]